MADIRTEKQQPDGSWLEVPFEELRTGDVFKAFAPDGSPAFGYAGPRRVTSDPKPHEHEGEPTWSLMAEEA